MIGAVIVPVAKGVEKQDKGTQKYLSFEAGTMLLAEISEVFEVFGADQVVLVSSEHDVSCKLHR